jgi:hypothetical protein
MYPELTIEETAQWQSFANPRQDIKLDVIVDPMIYRTADVFLRGKSGVTRTMRSLDQVRQAINRNIDALTIFFDLFILSDNLPIIDYGVTFDPHVGLDSSEIIDRCNQVEKVLTSVHVCGRASSEAREAALELMKSRTAVPEPLAQDLREEMSALEYAWQPDLSPLGSIEERDVPVNRFLYGAALFGAFARMAEIGHMFQPKRSQAYLAASLHADASQARDETSLYEKLREVIQEASAGSNSTAHLDGLPPFLPYLLRKDPETPAQLLSHAADLRKTGMVKDYRDWRNGLIREWRDKGRIRDQYRKELSDIAQKVKKEFGPSRDSQIEMKVTMTGLDPAWNVPVDRIWGWVYSQLPGRRYMKVLTRLALAQAEYEHLDRHVGTIWNAA